MILFAHLNSPKGLFTILHISDSKVVQFEEYSNWIMELKTYEINFGFSADQVN